MRRTFFRKPSSKPLSTCPTSVRIHAFTPGWSIALNEGLMKLRKRRSDKSEPLEDAVDDEGQVMPREFRDWKPNPEQQMNQEEMERILLNAAQSLPASLRAVFFLRDVEELSTEETAEMLNLTTGAVKARLFRARLQLREELSKVFKESKP